MNLKELRSEIERREWHNSMAPFPPYDTDIINDLKKLEIVMSSKTNDEPITYCKTCLSIRIKTIEFKETNQEVDYCTACSNTELDETHIYDWERMYEEKYGTKFLNKDTE